jgi:mRNA-degrading endonuclease toxin of MazEF toxin-antitoxin module
MPRQGVASLDDITTIPMAILENLITSLTPAKLREVEDAIRTALDLPR